MITGMYLASLTKIKLKLSTQIRQDKIPLHTNEVIVNYIVKYKIPCSANTMGNDYVDKTGAISMRWTTRNIPGLSSR